MVGLLLLLTFPQAGGFPLEPDGRWIYAREGREGLMVDVAGTREIGGRKAVVLRVRNGSFLWSRHDLYVSDAGGGLRILGSTYFDHPIERDPPRVLLRSSLQEGTSWEEGIRSAVLGRESIRVGGVAYDAWKIRYELTRHLGTENDFEAWFTPGIGFVRFRYFQQSTLGRKKPLERPWTVDLVRYIKDRRAPELDYPPLDGADRERAVRWIGLLESEEPDVRDRCTRDLLRLGRGVTPVLKAALGRASSSETRGRLQDLIGLFPPLEVVGRLTKGTIRPGEPLPVEFRLRNVSERPLFVLPELDASDLGWRYPKCTVTLRYGGVLLEPEPVARCGNVNPLMGRDFVELAPGASLPPFRHPRLAWTPRSAGIYTVRFVYELGPIHPSAWGTSDGPPDQEALRLLQAMPRGRFESALTVVVEE